MMFRYSALDRQGRAVDGEIPADSRRGAIAALAEQGVFATEVRDGEAAAAPRTWQAAIRWPLSRRRLPPAVKLATLRQLATALQAGLPMLSALRVLQDQADTQVLRQLAGDLADRVQAGESLSAAMEARGGDFSHLEVSMVRVGETAGLLDQVMGHLSDFAERDLEVRQKVRSAATYPAFVLGLVVVAVVIVVAVIVPRVLAALSETTAALPAPTRALLAVSDLVRSYGLLLAAALVGGIAAFRAWARRPAGRLALDRFKLRIPVVRTALRKVAVARFARTLGTLSRSGIQILEALRVLRDTLGNEALAQKVDEVAAGITQGQSIAEPLRRTGEFPPLLIQVIAMGERTGRLDELLLQMAAAYEKETAASIQRVMTILPAIFIVLMALVVAFVLAAVLLPIVEMSTSIPGM